jgi:hypothetical protein
MSQMMLQKENQIVKQSKSSSLQNQHSENINTIASNKLTNEHKHRSGMLSNGIERVIGFIQRKMSRVNNEEKTEFDELEKIK